MLVLKASKPRTFARHQVSELAAHSVTREIRDAVVPWSMSRILDSHMTMKNNIGI